METHRCEGSLKIWVSIRKCNPYKILPEYMNAEDAWWLLMHDHDFDYDSHYLQPIAQINYCPFCGVKL